MKNAMMITLALSLLVLSACTSTRNLSSLNRDGSSFEKAIIAESVSSEYEYVREICPSCQFLEQELVFEKNQPYDILTFEDANGETKKYYFDISSFFGKGLF